MGEGGEIVELVEMGKVGTGGRMIVLGSWLLVFGEIVELVEMVEGVELGEMVEVGEGAQETKTQRILSQTDARKLELKLKDAWEMRGKERARISRKMR